MAYRLFDFIIPPPSRHTSRVIQKILDKTTGLDLWFLIRFPDNELEDYLIRLYSSSFRKAAKRLR